MNEWPDFIAKVHDTPIEKLFINSGWGTHGFKATPGVGWVMALTMTHGKPH
jgi:sarcosine oxidase subunit beta